MAAAKHGKKGLVITIVVVLVIAAGVGLWYGLRPPTASSTGPTTTTRDATASLVTMTTSVGATGTMEPAQEASLSFGSSGTVTSVNVAVGDQVTQGEALAAIDLTNLQAAVTAAQDSVTAAQSDLTTAQSSGTTAAITAATSNLTTKQDALAQAQSALAAGTLTAPFAGTVAAVNVSVGATVGSGSSSGSGSGGSGSGAGAGYGAGGGTTSSSSSAAITVITADQYVVSVGVGSNDIGQIKKGMSAQVTPTGATTPLSGTVTGVGVIASTSSSASGSTTASFPVTIALDGTQNNLYAGISASVSIILTSRDNVLAVPTQAITLASDGSASVQKQQADGTFSTTAVTVGQTDGTDTEITAGLSQGDVVQITEVTQTGTSGTGGTTGRTGTTATRGGGGEFGGTGLGGIAGGGGGGFAGGAGGGTRTGGTYAGTAGGRPTA